jgi:DHA1 family tetracycline resistance protein-like MFS transporter
MVKLLGERRLLVTGLMFSLTEQVLLGLAATKAQAVAAVSLSAFAGVSFPALSSLKSTHASADEQGLVQGALAGIRALASGLGPLALAQLFSASTTAEAVLGYHPAAVFV